MSFFYKVFFTAELTLEKIEGLISLMVCVYKTIVFKSCWFFVFFFLIELYFDSGNKVVVILTPNHAFHSYISY